MEEIIGAIVAAVVISIFGLMGNSVLTNRKLANHNNSIQDGIYDRLSAIEKAVGSVTTSFAEL